jgi:MoaA/NifB/PqqE/SkfB family radical SAM enzyme
MDLELLKAVVSEARTMGYEVLSVSGGEPLLYAGLAEVLRLARSSGMRTTVTTNGYFLSPRYLEPLQGCLDVLAISLDGPPEIHNRMRASPQAFDRLSRGLEDVRASGIGFGFLHTATAESWVHLLWVAEIAAANGARLLQIHPLELAGRAQNTLQRLAPMEDVLSKVYLLSTALAYKYAGVMAIQTDLLHRDQVLANSELIYAGPSHEDAETAVPASVLSTLVVEPDGTLVPVTYGFSRRYQICNVNRELPTVAWPRFLRDIYPAFYRLCRRVFTKVTSSDAEPLFNWHEKIAAQSHCLADLPAIYSDGSKATPIFGPLPTAAD